MNKNYRDTWAEIDFDKLTHNYEQIKKLRTEEKMIAVIKANAYGHGDVQMAKLFSELGAEYLAVSSLDEALKLRKNNINIPIIVLAPIKISDINIAIEFDITIIAYDEEWVNELVKLPFSKSLKIHLEVETGMNRIGLRDVIGTYQVLSNLEHIIIEGIYTHIASADSNMESVDEQINRFNDILD